MRIVPLLVSVAVLVAGAVVMFVPIATASHGMLSNEELYVGNISGFSPTGAIDGSLSWTASASVTLTFYTCSTVVVHDFCNGTSTLSTENGTGGTFPFHVNPGGAVAAGFVSAPGVTGSVTVQLAQPSFGTVVVVMGVLLLIVGMMLPTRPRAVTPSPSHAPPEPPVGP